MVRNSYEPIEIKTVGLLIDELGTSRLKLAHGIKGARERVRILEGIINLRLPDENWQSWDVVRDLYRTLEKCWNAQEAIMDSKKSSDFRLEAAITAQKTNAQRAELIREIDSAAGSLRESTLEKSYE